MQFAWKTNTSWTASCPGVCSPATFKPFQRTKNQHMMIYFTFRRYADSAGENVLRWLFWVRSQGEGIHGGRWNVCWSDDPNWVTDAALLGGHCFCAAPGPSKLMNNWKSRNRLWENTAFCLKKKPQKKSQSIARKTVAEWCTAFSTDERASSNENPLQDANQCFADFRAPLSHFPAVCRPLLSWCDVGTVKQRTTVNLKLNSERHRDKQMWPGSFWDNYLHCDLSKVLSQIISFFFWSTLFLWEALLNSNKCKYKVRLSD